MVENIDDVLSVSVILVNYNTCRITQNCIDSIFCKTKDISFEVVLIDNASIDDSKAVFETDKRIKYIYNNENLGFGLANNIGVDNSKGRNVLFLNTDTLLINNAIKILSDFLDNNTSVAACGGNLYDEGMCPVHSYRMFFPSIFGELNNLSNNMLENIIWKNNAQFNYTGEPKAVAYITGADLMIRRSVLDDIGLFSSNFFMYYEETELLYRLKKRNMRVFSVPAAQIQHLEGKSMGSKKYNLDRIFLMDESRYIFYHTCYTLFYSVMANIILVINVCLRFSLLFIRRDKRYKYHMKRLLNLLNLTF